MAPLTSTKQDWQSKDLDNKKVYITLIHSTRITPVKKILAITALRNEEVHQMDVKMTFLNRDLEKSSLLSLAVQLTVLAVVPWETDDESVLREACQTRASAL
ncbi:hypothetical protein Tco_0143653 [Tanacetum coccineum]